MQEKVLKIPKLFILIKICHQTVKCFHLVTTLSTILVKKQLKRIPGKKEIIGKQFQTENYKTTVFNWPIIFN